MLRYEDGLRSVSRCVLAEATGVTYEVKGGGPDKHKRTPVKRPGWRVSDLSPDQPAFTTNTTGAIQASPPGSLTG